MHKIKCQSHLIILNSNLFYIYNEILMFILLILKKLIFSYYFGIYFKFRVINLTQI